MNKSSFWMRFDVWYVALTLIYCILVFAGLGMKIDCFDVCTHPALPNGTWYTDLIGLFVPFGPNNSILLLFVSAALFSWLPNPLNFICALALSIAILIAIAYVIEKFLRRFSFNPVIKIVVNLIILLAATLVIDLIMFHTWTSLNLLIQSLQ